MSGLARVGADMAAGDVLLTPDGEKILDAFGNVQLSDGAGDDCCCSDLGDYIQARKCRDQSNADLWILYDDITVPYYFHKSSVCYFMDDDCPRSDTPGTILTGQTEIASCGVSPCDCTDCPDETPGQYTVTFACNTSYKGVGTLNGTYCLTRTGESSCTWQAVATGATIERYPFVGCGGSPNSSGSPTITLSRTSGLWQLVVRSTLVSATMFEDANVSATNCNASANFTNEITACGGTSGGNFVTAHSGTATITPGFC